ncbi:MAG TPA: glutathione S-transferase N-terminal domain-containing protein [Hyphomonadaceae bacterium]|jgi:glutathione S-transferase|nr:glutathione S-transferase N-terminal domain-containing protein [Hyphomonadaceae bacterium]
MALSPKPVDVHFWPTPNGRKVTIALEEMELPYRIVPVNIGKGEQFSPEFLAISPNNRMPALVDPEGPDGEPISLFESGAILQYLARKTGKFGGANAREQAEVESWTYWQTSNLGPVMGHHNHFRNYAPKVEPDPEKLKYGQDRFFNETNRLFGVLEVRLRDREFIAGELSIADFASWPWIAAYKSQGQNLEDFPSLNRWFGQCRLRPGFEKGRKAGEDLSNAAASLAGNSKEAEEARKILFGQKART